MNKILELARQHLMHERWSRYGESVEEDYYEFYPGELAEFASEIIKACADYAFSDEQEQKRMLEHFGVQYER